MATLAFSLIFFMVSSFRVSIYWLPSRKNLLGLAKSEQLIANFFLEPGSIVNNHNNCKESGSEDGYFSGLVDFCKSFHKSNFLKVSQFILYRLWLIKDCCVLVLLKANSYKLIALLEPGWIIKNHYNWKESGSKDGYFSGLVDFCKRFHILGFKCFLIGTSQMLK